MQTFLAIILPLHDCIIQENEWRNYKKKKISLFSLEEPFTEISRRVTVFLFTFYIWREY